MYNKAQAKICGRLGKNVKVKKSKNGDKYGIITIAVNKIIGLVPDTEEPIIKAHWFTVLIWNSNLLEKYSTYLRKGEKVIVEGELEVVDRSILKETDDFEDRGAVHKATSVIIKVKQKNGITILAKLPVPKKENVLAANDQFVINGMVNSSIIESISRGNHDYSN